MMVELANNETVINRDDVMNISKWVTATSMMIEGKLRTPFSESEIKTWDKIKHLRDRR